MYQSLLPEVTIYNNDPDSTSQTDHHKRVDLEVLVFFFLHLACSFLVFRNAATLLHEHTVNWRVCSLTRDETTSVRTFYCYFHQKMKFSFRLINSN